MMRFICAHVHQNRFVHLIFPQQTKAVYKTQNTNILNASKYDNPKEVTRRTCSGIK
uniref:Uncharacterized protein n=1 Tax=Arundo donax TaxID=35708 RepID=A0A0A9ABJ7_ARUDO